MKKLLFILLLLAGKASFSQSEIPIADVSKHIGDSVTVKDKIYSVKVFDNGMTLLNLGGNFPNHLLVVMIPARLRLLFNVKPEDLKGYSITASGRLIDYKGKPEIVVTSEGQLTIEPIAGDTKAKRPKAVEVY